MAHIAREMLISADAHETRVAILEDRRLMELYVERAHRSVVGNVYLGKVRDVLPGMEAAFVDIGLEKNAFLYVDEVVVPDDVARPPHADIQALLQPGQELIVQVLKDPMGTKGARVTTEITLPGRFLVLLPFTPFVGVSRKLDDEERERLTGIMTQLVSEGAGVIVRTAAAGCTRADLAGDLDFLLRLWNRVQQQAAEVAAPAVVYTEMDVALRLVRDAFTDEFQRLTVDDRRLHEKVTAFLAKTAPQLIKRVHLHKDRSPLFDVYGIQTDIESALVRSVDLPSGGHITIDHAEALTAIDVNTGSFVGRTNLEDTVLRTNLEAAVEAVRQIRLRDIGGIIVIDFIDMEDPRNRQLLFDRLAEELKRDRTRTRLSEMSRLGLVELTRKNVTDGLCDVLTEVCPTCGGEGRVISDATRRISAERRLREIATSGRSAAYLVGVDPRTYALISDSGRDVVGALRAETGRQISIMPDLDAGPIEVRILMEGRTIGEGEGAD